MIEKNVVVGPFQCNCRILSCTTTGDTVLVDPGDEPEKILSALKEVEAQFGRRIKVRGLFHTHAHLDHMGATRSVKEALLKDAEVDALSEIFLHAQDHDLYLNLKAQGEMFGFQYEDPLPVDRFFEDEEELQFGSLKFTILHTPGHSPGGVCIQMHEDSQEGISETVFSGDTLFQGSVGRTDLWGGDSDTLIKSIKKRVLTLDDDIRVCPGHGPETRVGVEKRSNPFLA
jgi:hydroxyacylglutathione hydrolase